MAHERCMALVAYYLRPNLTSGPRSCPFRDAAMPRPATNGASCLLAFLLIVFPLDDTDKDAKLCPVEYRATLTSMHHEVETCYLPHDRSLPDPHKE